MEENKQQGQPLKKGKPDKMKTAGVASHVAGAAGIGAASYAYGKHRASEEGPDNEMTGRRDEDTEKKRVDREEQEQTAENQVQENGNNNVPDGEVVAEPEPIAHTDGIDFVVRVDDTGRADEAVFSEDPVTVTEVEPIEVEPVADFPEPVLPEPNLIAGNGIDETDFVTAGADTASCEIPNDFIGNGIQQDLLG